MRLCPQPVPPGAGRAVRTTRSAGGYFDTMIAIP